jgi:hypothetical protein
VLIYALEAEARKAGGGVLFVLGNHETMVMRDDLRLSQSQVPAVCRDTGVDSYSQLFGPDSVLGQWLRNAGRGSQGQRPVVPATAAFRASWSSASCRWPTSMVRSGRAGRQDAGRR